VNSELKNQYKDLLITIKLKKNKGTQGTKIRPRTQRDPRIQPIEYQQYKLKMLFEEGWVRAWTEAHAYTESISTD